MSSFGFDFESFSLMISGSSLGTILLEGLGLGPLLRISGETVRGSDSISRFLDLEMDLDLDLRYF